MTAPAQWYDAFFQDLKKELNSLESRQLFVGYSGGLDSRLLLELACRAIGADRVTAIHVNHGLSANAPSWLNQCQQVCQQLGCELIVCQGEVRSQGGGIEAAAREFRYRQFQTLMPKAGTLLLGHHLDDQVETFFLRLMRGAGPHGLKAMARLVSRDHYQILRPLLDLSKQQLTDIANELGLSWVDDESNDDVLLDRNYLRHQVLPLLEARWPGYRDRVQNAIRLMASPPEAVDDFSVEDELKHRLSFDNGLKLVQLDKLTEDQILSLLHAWLTAIGQQVPSRERLKSIYSHVIQARADATPQVKLGGGDIRRHGPAIYWVRSMPEPGTPPAVCFNELQPWRGVGRVAVEAADTGVERIKAGLPKLNWRLRTEGEVMQPIGRSKSRDLKRLLQEYRVKPWLRYRVPLLYSGEDLVAVGDLLIHQSYQASENEPGLRVVWENNAIPD